MKRSEYLAKAIKHNGLEQPVDDNVPVAYRVIYPDGYISPTIFRPVLAWAINWTGQSRYDGIESFVMIYDYVPMDRSLIKGRFGDDGLIL